jgi:hypothetical protein
MKRLIAILTAIAILIVLTATAGLAQPTKDKSGTFTIEIASGWATEDGNNLINAVGPRNIARMSITSAACKGVTFAQFEKSYMSTISKQLRGFKLISKGKASIAEAAGGVWVYKAVFSKVTLQFKNYVVFKDETMYNVVVATLPQRFKSDAAAVDKMVKSWKWL